MKPYIRKMTEAELSRVLQILAQWNMTPVPPSAETPDPEVAEIIVTNTFVAEVHGQIVGCASYFDLGGGTCETSSFAVDPTFTGQGVGLALQRARLLEMKSRGAVRVVTQTDRADTVRWYLANFPYRVTGTIPKRHAFGDIAIDSWTVLELDLASYDPDSPRPSTTVRRNSLV